MTTFALVHGGWHGGWCWERVESELQSRGHSSIVMDLPIDDRDAGLAVYRDVVRKAIGSTPPDDLVLVGHSMGGLVVPYIARDLGAKRVVYVTAVLPVPGRSFLETSMEDALPGRSRGFTMREDGAAVWTLEAATEFFYADCSPQDARWAFDHLRPQFWTPGLEPAADIDLPSIPSTYISCRDDRMVPFERGIRHAKERVGVDAIEMDGSHSPFLSRPAELAAVLMAV